MRGSNINNDIWCSSRGRRTLDCVSSQAVSVVHVAVGRVFVWAGNCGSAPATTNYMDYRLYAYKLHVWRRCHLLSHFYSAALRTSTHYTINTQKMENFAGLFICFFSQPFGFGMETSIFERFFFIVINSSIARVWMHTNLWYEATRCMCALVFSSSLSVFNLMLRLKKANITQTDERQRERDINRRD